MKMQLNKKKSIKFGYLCVTPNCIKISKVSSVIQITGIKNTLEDIA